MPLYDDLETRVPAQMTPSRGYTLGEAVLGGAQVGARGGSVMGAPVRGGAAGAAQRLQDIEYWDKGPDFGMRDFVDPTSAEMAERAQDAKFYTEELAGYRGRPSISAVEQQDIDDLRRALDRPFYQTRAEARAPYRDRIHLAKAGLRHGRATGWDRTAMTDELMKGPSAWLGREYHQGVPIEEVRRGFEQYDRMIPPSRMSRVGSVLKAGLRGALAPANIIKDAIGGSIVGGLSAGAGHIAGRPTSAGQLSLPQGSPLLDAAGDGPVDQATFLRAIEAAAQRKEALRSQYIDEINSRFGMGTVGPGARMEEISEYLGPVAPINR